MSRAKDVYGCMQLPGQSAKTHPSPGRPHPRAPRKPSGLQTHDALEPPKASKAHPNLFHGSSWRPFGRVSSKFLGRMWPSRGRSKGGWRQEAHEPPDILSKWTTGALCGHLLPATGQLYDISRQSELTQIIKSGISLRCGNARTAVLKSTHGKPCDADGYALLVCLQRVMSERIN